MLAAASSALSDEILEMAGTLQVREVCFEPVRVSVEAARVPSLDMPELPLPPVSTHIHKREIPSTCNEFGANAPSSPRAEVCGAENKCARRSLSSPTRFHLRAAAVSFSVVTTHPGTLRAREQLARVGGHAWG